MTLTIDLEETAWSASAVDVLDAEAGASIAPERLYKPWSIAADQVYYWTALWQAGEQETDADVASGDVVRFDDTDDAIRWLLGAD